MQSIKYCELYKLVSTVYHDRMINMIDYVVDIMGEDTNDHGINHIMTVAIHTIRILTDIGDIRWHDMFTCVTAALIHELDDSKLFNTVDYANARMFLAKFCDAHESEVILFMIQNCSCSKVGNNVPAIPDLEVAHKWERLYGTNAIKLLLSVRWADYLESCGEIGLIRTNLYSIEIIDNSIARDAGITKTKKGARRSFDTPLLRECTWDTIESMINERHKQYMGVCTSTIDALIDRLVPLHRPYCDKQCDHANTGIPYLDHEFARRESIWVSFLQLYCYDRPEAKRYIQKLTQEAQTQTA